MKNKSTTKKGPGIVHQDGYKKPRKKRKEVSFSLAIREWITQLNLKNIAKNLAKKQRNAL